MVLDMCVPINHDIPWTAHELWAQTIEDIQCGSQNLEPPKGNSKLCVTYNSDCCFDKLITIDSLITLLGQLAYTTLF